MKRKIIMILTVVLLMTVFFISCSSSENAQEAQTIKETIKAEDSQTQKPKSTPIPPQNRVSVGLAYTSEGYEANLIKNQIMNLMAISSIQINVFTQEAKIDNPEDAIEKLINDGCDIIFLYKIDENIVMQYAKQYPNVNFEIYAGRQKDVEENVSSFYARVYQYQYLNGMIAGLISKTGSIAYISEGINNDDIRRVNAFALGVKAGNANAKVNFVWREENTDKDYLKEQYKSLLDENCDIFMKFEIDEELYEYSKANDILLLGSRVEQRDDIIKMIEPTLIEYALDKARETADGTYKANDIYAGWINIKDYEIDEDDYPMLSQDEIEQIQTALNKMAEKSWDVFTGPIVDTYGQVIIPEGMVIPDEDLFYMLWYVQNIEAMSPPMG